MKFTVSQARDFKQPDTSDGYHAYLQSDAWRVKRSQVLIRAGNRCESCLTSGVPLEVHHKTYKRLGVERLDDLAALCIPCHDRADAERRKKMSRFDEWRKGLKSQ